MGIIDESRATVDQYTKFQSFNAPSSTTKLDSSSTLQMPSTMTHEQNNQIYEILRRKAEEERAAAAEKAKPELEKAKLEIELMRKESNT